MKKISFFALAHYYSHAILCTILFTISRAHSYSCQKCYYIFPKVVVPLRQHPAIHIGGLVGD